MAEYTPSEDEMRHGYQLTRMLDHYADVDAAFDRFIARVRREAKAEAWDECVRAAYAPGGRITHGPNPYETGDRA